MFSVMRKMFNLSEVRGYRSDGTNPCRYVPIHPNVSLRSSIRSTTMSLSVTSN